jgi:hypothetical protein
MAKKRTPNMAQTSQSQSNTFIGGMNRDSDPSFIKKGQWTHARNSVNNTSEGDLGTLSNEASNYLCAESGKNLNTTNKEIIGAIHLFSDKWIIFTTSVDFPFSISPKYEIGLFEEDKCRYRTIVQDNCLNFDRYSLITGGAREQGDCSWGIYWSDGKNPDRFLNVGDPQTWPGNEYVWSNNNEYSDGTNTIQWPGIEWMEICTDSAGVVQTEPGVWPIGSPLGCVTCVNTQDLNCEAIRLARLMKTPCVKVSPGNQGGTLFNGSYFVVIAYSIKGQKVTDYFSPSNVQPIWHKDNSRGSLQIDIVADSENFDEFELVVIQNVNQGAVAKRVGTYSTRTTTIYLDQIKPDLIPVPLNIIPIQNPVYERSDEIVEVNSYLLRVGPTAKFDFNYQPLANLIKAKWASVEYPDSYYTKGGHKPSYLRDENYSFFIRWVYGTGDKSSSYHIPGRGPELYGDTGLYENSVYSNLNSLADDTLLFETINTASQGAAPGTVLEDGGIVLRTGDMGYWQSTEVYPDNKPDIWNSSLHCWTGKYNQPSINYDLCGLPIRHHKFPEQSIGPDVHHFTHNYSNGAKIRLLGVFFENIIYPKDNEGADIPGIVGYEILRGSREGNKTIIAKGMLNNMRPYDITGNTPTAGLYPNHPFNTIETTGGSGGNNGDITGIDDPYIRCIDDNDDTIHYTKEDIPKDIVTFHSPDTEFKDPYLATTELKLYGNVTGTTTQQFIEPENHPEHKLLRDIALFAAVVGGIIEAIIANLGKRTINAPGASFTRVFGDDYTQEKRSGGNSVNTLTGVGLWTAIGGSSSFTGNIDTSQDGGDGNTEIYEYTKDLPGEDGVALFSDPNALEETFTDAYDEYFNSGQAVNEGLQGTIFAQILPLPPETPLDEHYDEFNSGAGLVPGGTYTAPVINTELSKHQYVKDNPELATLSNIAGKMLYYFSEGADLVLRLIYTISPYRQYALQLIAHGFYRNFNAVTANVTKRFNIEDEFYLGQNIQEMRSYTPTGLNPVTYKINNLKRSETVVLRTSKTVNRVTDGPNLLTGDDSLVTVGTAGSDVNFNKDKTNEFNKNIQSHYGGIKVRIGNQYGQLENIKQVPVGTCEEQFKYNSIPDTVLAPACNIQFTQKIIQTTPILFGGDTYINRYTEKNSMFMFHDWLYNQPDGFEYNYLNRKMIPNPRFWMNSQKYESNSIWGNLQDFLVGVNTEGEGLFPHEYYNLDYRNYKYGNDQNIFFGGTLNFGNGIYSVKKAFFYIATSAVKDFFVESDVIVDFRDQGDEIFEKHYDKDTYTDLYEMFKIDPTIITRGNYNEYDYSLSISKLFTQYFSQGNLQNRHYDPKVSDLCYTYYPDRILYSLPQQLESIKDSWFTYLPNNYKEFKNQISSVKNFAKTGMFITFKDASPLAYQGVDTLQTDLGTKITLGDGGLFNQAPQNIVVADDEYEYGSSQNRLSVITTPAGMYYISQNQGKIFSYGQGLQEISGVGLKWWFNKFLPYALLEDFPDYPHADNPVAGVGCHSTYDNENGTLYFAKKDYKLRDQFKDRVVFDTDLNLFIVDGVTRVDLDDTTIFQDASWTVSYDPKSKFWVSYHDWHPNFMLGSKNNFLTIKGDGIWKHNDICNDYCNFYGNDYPFEIEFPVVTGQTVTTMKSLEYILECYKRSAYNCVDQFQVLDYNFDQAVIHNSEQVSGYLNLNPYPKNNVPLNLTYPIVNASSIEILFSKEENKYRFNQFWDVTRNRGEFPVGSTSPTTNPVIPGTTVQFGGKDERHLWNTEANGYVKSLNNLNLNYSKDPLQRKKFRHYSNLVFLKRKVSGDTNMVLKIVNTKNQISPR